MSFVKMECFGQTDVGRQRDENEDQFLIADLVRAVRIQQTSLSYDDHAEVTGQSHGKIFLVADGMGGHAAGGRASTLAVDETIDYMVNRTRWLSFQQQRNAEANREALVIDLANALSYCQQRIRNEAQWNPDKHGMGTTLTIGIIDWPWLHVVHAGDSRCYAYHHGMLDQITRDHTIGQEFVDRGEMTEKEAAESSLGSKLWNVVGGNEEKLKPDVRSAELSIGDRLLLCTDGLTKHVSDAEIADVLRQDVPVNEACEILIQMANERGGSDNTTVIVVRFHGENHRQHEMKAEEPIASEETQEMKQQIVSQEPAEPVAIGQDPQ